MSDSRLEKFIYAICSMDVSDLPVPLSRIETLWNCLITGETPDFEPLSRNEKYLMAMLDRYDISNLPAPMSRGEKLLYKIAVGETDLSDVPGYLSRYEELLKYLIENGGIGFEYVLYTLNQPLSTLYTTAEKPVKSAILKGNTEKVFSPLKNLFDGFLEEGSIDNNNGVLISNGNYYRSVNFIVVEPSTNYIISTNGTVNGRLFYYDRNFNFICNSISSDKALSPSNANYMKFRVTKDRKDNKIQVEKSNVVTDYEEPNYILQSVKMPVLKTLNNIVDFSNEKLEFEYGVYFGQKGDGSDWVNNKGIVSSFVYTLNYIELLPNQTRLSTYGNDTIVDRVVWFDENKNQLGSIVGDNNSTLSIPTGAKYFRFLLNDSRFAEDKELAKDNIGHYNFYYGDKSQIFNNEPHKSNILTVNEPIELRRVGNVQDTLDLMTGELVQRIGEIKITDEMIDKFTIYRNFISNFESIFDGLPERKIVRFEYGNPIPMVSDKMAVKLWSNGTMVENTVYFTQDKDGDMRVYHTPDWTLDEFKEWFREKKPTIQYELATPIVKTVDLTTVDQDNQPTKLGTFENVTHISLESAGLIPTLEMEVATRISKELASASPLMDELSTEQQQLNTTVDEQSNNVDATMIATTEIYEETL